MFELKRLSREAIPAALEKAQRYRLLNEPGQAESICLDVLSVEPDNQEAVVTLILALSDQFERHLPTTFERARELAGRLAGEYGRAYYSGIICERRAKAQMRSGRPGSQRAAHDGLRQAMEHFERAAEVHPAGNEDALLRWNACARLLNQHPELAAAEEETFRPWLE